MDKRILLCFLSLLVFLISGCKNVKQIEPSNNPTNSYIQAEEKYHSTPTDESSNNLLLTPTMAFFATPNTTFAPTFAWWDEESEPSKMIGNTIVEALANFKQNNGQYPSALEELNPDYLNEIPKTVTGHPFLYDLYDKDYYILKFPFTRRNIACGYTPLSEEWECTHQLSYP